MTNSRFTWTQILVGIIRTNDMYISISKNMWGLDTYLKYPPTGRQCRCVMVFPRKECGWIYLKEIPTSWLTGWILSQVDKNSIGLVLVPPGKYKDGNSYSDSDIHQVKPIETALVIHLLKTWCSHNNSKQDHCVILQSCQVKENVHLSLGEYLHKMCLVKSPWDLQTHQSQPYKGLHIGLWKVKYLFHLLFIP